MSDGETPPKSRPNSAAIRETIVLVGMMGAGKSSVGRRLATQLALPFVDADSEIETAAGCSISDVFALHGEAAFRDGERRVIARLLDGPAHVLSTGGGAFMDADTRALVGKSGISVWLRADLATLERRTSRRPDRPLLQEDNPRAVLEKLLAARNPVYAQADIVVDSNDRPVEETVDMVIAKLQRFVAERGSPG